MPSPVSELRGPNIKHHEASFLEDYTFQQATPYIHALRDPVCNRVTLVGVCVCVFPAIEVTRSGLICSWLKLHHLGLKRDFELHQYEPYLKYMYLNKWTPCWAEISSLLRFLYHSTVRTRRLFWRRCQICLRLSTKIQF